MFKKALVPLDGSDLAEGILPYVSQISKGLNMPLVLLSVIDPDAVELPESVKRRPDESHLTAIPMGAAGAMTTDQPVKEPIERYHVYPHESGGPYASQIFEKVESDVKIKLEGIVKDLREQGVEAEAKVVFGRAAEVIITTAEREDVDLIAMSTHGRNTFGRGLLGSVTDKIAHSARVPVLTITPERAKAYWQDDEPISKVMVPLDGSLLAESALPYVEAIAEALSLKIVLVRVAKVGGMYTAYSDGYPYAGYANLEQEIEHEAVDYLNHLAERLRRKGLTVEWKLLRGKPSNAIVDLAHETSQDMIVLTTHGRSGFTRWMLGSVAENLVRASGDPVLIIPDDQRED